MPPDPSPAPAPRSVRYQDLHWSATDGAEMVGRQWIPSNPSASLLIIHGMGDHSGRFEKMATRFAESGFAVFAPDLRGHGRSSGPRGYFSNLSQLHDDLEDSLQRTKALVDGETPAPILYGQSFGGLLAIDFALQRQPKLSGLIASSPALNIAMPAPQWKVAVGRALRKIAPRLGLSSGLDLELLSDNSQVASRARSDRYRHGKITAPAFFGMLEAGQRSMNGTAKLPCPVLLLHGKQDRITDFESSKRFAEAYDATFARYDDGMHELHNMSYGDDVMQRMIDFAKEQLGK